MQLSSPHVAIGWRCIIGHIGAAVTCIDICPQYGLIASGDEHGHVAVWDLASRTFIASLQMDANSNVYGGVCGLTFDQVSGDLLVARVTPNRPHGEYRLFIDCSLIFMPE